MYLWRLEREARAQLIVCLSVGLFCPMSVIWMNQSRLQSGLWSVESVWRQTTGVAIVFTALATMMAALIVAGFSVGNEFATGTAEFLLTRARPCRYFVWAGWAFGLAQLVSIMVLVVCATVGALYWMTGTLVSFKLLAASILLIPLIAILFGVAFVLAVELRSGPQAMKATFLIAVLYFGASLALIWGWGIKRPDWWFDILADWVMRPGASFPSVALVGWTLFALLFPALAAWRLERTEV